MVLRKLNFFFKDIAIYLSCDDIYIMFNDHIKEN